MFLETLKLQPMPRLWAVRRQAMRRQAMLWRVMLRCQANLDFRPAEKLEPQLAREPPPKQHPKID